MNSKLAKYHPHQLVKSLAKQFKTTSKKDCLEEIIEIPGDIGTGRITGFDFGDGIGFITFDIKLTKDWQLNFKSSNLSPIYFNFLIEGKIWHTLNEGKIRYQLLPLQSSISSAPISSSQAFAIPRDQKLLFAILIIDRKKYLSTASCYFDRMHEKIAAVFKDVNGKEAFFHQSEFSINVSRIIKKITKNNDCGLARSIYIEAQVLELLSRQIKQVEDDFSMLGRRLKLRAYDIEKIKLARTILLEQMKNPPTIEKLAKKVGVNQSKLKEGFKLIFETTIKKYLTKERLEKASLLLIQDTSIKNAAMEVGYSNLSYFAKIFKEHYGVLPKDYVKNVQIRVNV